MQRLACGQALKLQLPDCSAPPTAAVLQRAGFADIAMVIAPATLDDVIALTPASQPARGVWQLRVVTDCGCYRAQIAVDSCKPLGFVGTHTLTAPLGIVTVCCDSEEGEDIVFASFTLTAQNIADGAVTLPYPLAASAMPIVWTVGGLIQQFDEDYTVSGTLLSWLGLGLEETLEVGDIIQIHYQRVL